MADAVWLITMFDLPVKTKDQRRRATQYRELLLDRGFDRVQLSVYAKYFLNGTAAIRDIGMLKASVPVGGAVRVLRVTDKQWSSTFRFEGPRQLKTERPPDQLTIF